MDQPNQTWCTQADVISHPAYAQLSTADAELMTHLCLVASTWLWRATGRQWSGPKQDTVRPAPRMRVADSMSRGQRYGSVLTDPTYFDSRFGSYGWFGAQGRGEWAHEIELGEYPIISVDEVVIDGVVFAATLPSGAPSYRLDDDRWLVRCDDAAWPCGQDWTLPSAAGALPAGAQIGTWEVTRTWGIGPPADAVHAAEILAGELGLANVNSDAARLNPRIQSISRQGESMLLMDPQLLIQGETWGVREIDMLAKTANPHKLVQATAVLSPDIPRAVRHTGSLGGS